MWKYATEDGIPKMIVVNAFDKEETDFDKTLSRYGNISASAFFL